MYNPQSRTGIQQKPWTISTSIESGRSFDEKPIILQDGDAIATFLPSLLLQR
jgi:hypothetical protein